MQHNISVRSACIDLSLSRGTYYYHSCDTIDLIEEKLLKYAKDYPKYGARKLYQVLRTDKDCPVVNHKKVARLYKKHHLYLRINKRKRKKVEKTPLVVPALPMTTWALDFVHDKLSNGNKIRCLTIIDEFNRESISIQIDRRINSIKLVKMLNELKFTYGLPKSIRSDNGKEFTATITQQWAIDNNIQWIFIQPGKPMQNGYCERFNGTFRNEILDTYLFETVAEAQYIANKWRNEYNNNRPHDSLYGLSPIKYKEKMMSEESI